MRKLVTLSMALASFAFAATASATLSATILGSNLPGTNVYTLVLSTDTADQIRGIVASVNTTGTYTGAFTDPGTVGGFTINLAGPTVTPLSTGLASQWGFVAASPQPGGSYTIGTVTITVAAGQFVMPSFAGPIDGFVTNSFSTVGPNGPVTGVTIIPEPTTAGLLGLGIVGLVLAGRRSRA